MKNSTTIDNFDDIHNVVHYGVSDNIIFLVKTGGYGVTSKSDLSKMG